MPQASIRAQIAGHQDWGTRLTPEQLDELAAYVGDVAGRGVAAAPSGSAAVPPGLALWRANGCGSCHVLAAAGQASPSGHANP
jgi:hypothetical protein